MSEQAKRLREALRGIVAGTPHAMDLRRAEEATRALESLLAEHRAEAASARDAALEAAAGVDLYWLSPNDRRSVAERIRALQSRPVSVLPAERVRSVLLSAAAMLNRQGYGSGIIRDIARDLGVDLDATGGCACEAGRMCPPCQIASSDELAASLAEEPREPVTALRPDKGAMRIEDGHWKGEAGCLDTCPTCAGETSIDAVWCEREGCGHPEELHHDGRCNGGAPDEGACPCSGLFTSFDEPLATPPPNPKAGRRIVDGHWQQSGACMADCPGCANG